MSKCKQPQWILNDHWAVSIDPYNWILYRLSGSSWRPVGYYRNPELLLESLYRKLARTEPRQPTVEQHLEHCLGVAQAAAASFMECMATYPPEVLKQLPAAYRTMLKGEAANDELHHELNTRDQ